MVDFEDKKLESDHILRVKTQCRRLATPNALTPSRLSQIALSSVVSRGNKFVFSLEHIGEYHYAPSSLTSEQRPNGDGTSLRSLVDFWA